MLGDKNATSVIAVKDMEAAKKFYERTLGLQEAEFSDPSGTLYKSGESRIFVYPSQYAGTNQATAIAWNVEGDLEKIVAGLKDKGVVFEHYDNLPETKLEGDIHIYGGGKMKSVWFKDPDGNILNVSQM